MLKEDSVFNLASDAFRLDNGKLSEKKITENQATTESIQYQLRKFNFKKRDSFLSDYLQLTPDNCRNKRTSILTIDDGRKSNHLRLFPRSNKNDFIDEMKRLPSMSKSSLHKLSSDVFEPKVVPSTSIIDDSKDLISEYMINKRRNSFGHYGSFRKQKSLDYNNQYGKLYSRPNPFNFKNNDENVDLNKLYNLKGSSALAIENHLCKDLKTDKEKNNNQRSALNFNSKSSSLILLNDRDKQLDQISELYKLISKAFTNNQI